jgi:hypothetical protein
MAELQPHPWHPHLTSPDIVQRSKKITYRSIWYVRFELDDVGLEGLRRLAPPGAGL